MTKTLFVRILPKASPEKFFRCGIEFSREWKPVNDPDKATFDRLESEQMLETSKTVPEGYTPAEIAAEAPAADDVAKQAATSAKAKK